MLNFESKRVMNKSKSEIVFLLASIDAPHIIKRIGEFIERGYKVNVFGFKHFREPNLLLPKNINIEIIGVINQANYWKRIKTIVKGVRYVINKCKNKKVIYYLPSLDVAMFHRVFSTAPYIYEESDLKHTYVSSKLIQKILEVINKRIIKNARVSAFTSEGFLEYHFGDKWPHNSCLVPNRLNDGILNLQKESKGDIDINHIKFAFVGKAQFMSTFLFAKYIVENYQQHEMHFYGTTDSRDAEVIERLKTYDNCFFHGRFSNPDDLPNIYKNVDIVIALYDTDSINVLFAEPNKLYESIFFRTPIIVSSGTFLAKKISRLGIGYDLDATSRVSLDEFMDNLSEHDLKCKIKNASVIPEIDAINNNQQLFDLLDLQELK